MSLKIYSVAYQSIFGYFLALLFTLSSPSVYADWGDDIERFVDKEVPQLTGKYVEDDLKKRWLDSYLSPLAQTTKLQMEIASRTDNFQVPQIEGQLNVSQAISILRTIDAKLASLRFDQSRLEHLEKVIDKLSDSCNDESVYGGFAISSLGALAIGNVVLPDRPQFVLVWFGEPYFISTIISAVFSIAQWDEDKRRRKKASEAMDRLPTRLVSATWTIQKSKEICEDVLSLRADALKSYKISIRNYQDALNRHQESLWAAYHQLESTLGQAAFIDVFQRAGIWKMEVARAQRLASARLLVDLELARNEIDQLSASAASADGCRAGIALIEGFEDALIELRAQLGVYLARPQLPDTQHRLNNTLKWLDERSGIPAKYFDAARARGCTS